jgi:uncharacterized protein
VTLPLQQHGESVRFLVKVVPGASRDRIAAVLGDQLKVQVAAPPEGGKANARVCELLAAALSLPARAVTVASGHASPRKTIAVTGLDRDQVQARLQAALVR